MENKIYLNGPADMDGFLRTMFPVELELNRKWIYNDSGDEIIGETNFIITEEFAKKAFEELNEQNVFGYKYSDFEDFLESYEPETEGEAIYQFAIAQNELQQDLGEQLY